jgi:uncharacterized membrane protein
MAFCATCGAQVEGRFCAKCGSPVAAAAPGAGASAPPPPGQGYPPPPGYGQQPGGYPPQPGMAPAVAAPMADNVAGTLCYVLGFITGIIFLVMAPYSQNRAVRFHAFQSIFMSVGLIAIRIVIGGIFGTMLFTTGFGTLWMLWGFFWMLFSLACFVLWIYILIQTYQGRTIVLPIVGPLAQKQA